MSVGIAPGRFIVSGQGEYAPVFANDTQEHKELNARVDIIIVYQVDSNIIGTGNPGITPWEQARCLSENPPLFNKLM